LTVARITAQHGTSSTCARSTIGGTPPCP
jgi:hypothetical protein